AVFSARLSARLANASWRLSATAGEILASPTEVRERFGGIIFVGDSQIREIAWAALQLLTPALRFAPSDPVLRARGRGASGLSSSCVPQAVGKTGFTATCEEGEDACHIHSPFKNKSHAEKMRRLLLTRPHQWDGNLSVSEQVCSSSFFVSYQATWGAVPVLPESIPACLHGKRGADGRVVKFGLVRGGVRLPVL
ncbi:MAG: hypothetical protein SGPRY_014726, partial [Prymnesium sp.]